MGVENVKAGLELIGSVIQSQNPSEADTAQAGQVALNLLGEFMLSQFRCEEYLRELLNVAVQEQNARLGR